MNKVDIDLVIEKVLQEKKFEIAEKMDLFSSVNIISYKDTFLELVFVILAAGTSAELALKTVNALKLDNCVFVQSLDQIVVRLKSCYRFYNLRGKYIFNTREYLENFHKNEFAKIFKDNSSHYNRRRFFSSNPGIQGVGMKAASHFLRNIGFDDYAILDKHIINLLKDSGLISKKVSVLNEQTYIEIENILKVIALRHNLSLSSLDLILWYSKTGKIIK